ncbi:glucosamine-6-phosphate deaminase [Dielma fastidiosa]|uniref:Glucosamine-6-phosphate deaminase n=1 Tax=Dielma fastidiosa TaxID=1034346 RepID=A0AB35UGV5_9FIRM|nr:glucosamine-6-phosphate deaminase [Dielma fastidiosa]MDY5166623.1 glucosamine-6-phosphate deaminase [Dielma fastidiosa]
MKVIRCRDKAEVGKAACAYTIQAMMQPNAHIAITGGSTPKEMYEYLVPLVCDNPAFSHVQYYNFDEIPQVGEHEGLTMQALRSLFFTPANIDEKQIHILNEKNYMECEAALAAVGYLDYVVLGLGKDGHFCGNLPHTCTFDDDTHAVACDLNPTLYNRIKFLSGDNENKMPDAYVTMGPRTIMRSKQIVMIVNGKAKAEIVKRALWGEITAECPSSIFQLHPNFILILDAEAASELTL